MKLLCVFSTLTSPVHYPKHRPGPEGSAPIEVEGEGVTIKGGAGVADKNILTPRGVATMVTEAQAEVLKNNPVFQLHQANGFVTLEEVKRPPNADAVEGAVANMEGRDGSAPLVPEDFTAGGVAAPTTGGDADGVTVSK